MAPLTKNKRRAFHILLLLSMLFLVLVYRLFVIQIKDVRDFSTNHINLLERSVNQRKQEFILSSGRGNIYDHKYRSLINQEEIKTVVVFPFSKDNINLGKIKELASIINIDYQKLLNQVQELSKPSYITKNGKPIKITKKQQIMIERLQIPGIISASYTINDYNNVLAKHVIGYLGQAPNEIRNSYHDYLERGILKWNSLIGRSGLQLTFQEILIGVGESKIAYFVDNRGRPLNGLAYKYQTNEDEYYPLSLVTTLDKDIQAFAERQLVKNRIREGSVVILDVNNADILAMASLPDFDLLNVDPNSPDWNNKAVQVIEPGSIFKTLIAIAALEERVVNPEDKFYCASQYSVYGFSCYKDHEEMTFEEGYAKSCNVVFAEIAEGLGPGKIEEYAKKLGLVGTIGWTGEFFKEDSFAQIGDEEANRVFHSKTNKSDIGSVIRTAIGQQDVRVSPLAAANLVVTVLNDGFVYQPRLIEKVIYKNGMEYYNFKVHKSDTRIGNRETYREIRKMMEKVVEEGTGRLLKRAKWKLAGKSGTAETKNNLVNQWFIGYGPVGSPKYAVAVMVKDVATSEPLAKRVFMGIMDDLALWEQKEFNQIK
ncbi:hypothetical protein BHF71_02985 [Vulcanibacillus modesticaldus]|uniref:serine-type D-Ala-D-Ala carboxypeptidase n=1 Tax=Vulcanibacillus modesticaldus TaxID=337097 RepID=A0A1D2YTA1_9BACI|nr:penicillin-binding transpeptidase domain-containing protein [Vulcanibacillus modesticaldus]OEF98907.1 hypothetical protein BHF71_02985 [Vulcanibacillus modesticaldus]